MNISVSVIDEQQNRKEFINTVGRKTDIDIDVEEFSESSSLGVEGAIFSFKALFSRSNFKGNLLVSRDDKPFINTLTTIDGTFTLMSKISNQLWLEVIISE